MGAESMGLFRGRITVAQLALAPLIWVLPLPGLMGHGLIALVPLVPVLEYGPRHPRMLHTR